MKTNNLKSKSRDSKLSTMLQNALKLHQTGKLEEASFVYNMILEEQHNNIDAISLLGTLKMQTGNHDEATDYVNLISCQLLWSRIRSFLGK